MATQKGAPAGHRVRKRRGATRRGSCPPHGPILVDASEGSYYVASCLGCGLRGPEREDGREAKLAFDEAFQPPRG